MDENNKPQSDFDLDAALAEKFQQVQQDANRLRAMNDNTDTPASSPVPEPTEVPQEQPEPETGSPAPDRNHRKNRQRNCHSSTSGKHPKNRLLPPRRTKPQPKSEKPATS